MVDVEVAGGTKDIGEEGRVPLPVRPVAAVKGQAGGAGRVPLRRDRVCVRAIAFQGPAFSPGRLQGQRTDAELLDELREERRSQRAWTAQLAAVRWGERMADDALERVVFGIERYTTRSVPFSGQPLGEVSWASACGRSVQSCWSFRHE